MSELARPVAKRLQRPSWRDSRLLVGVLLVLVATVLGAKAVASTDDRVPVFVAASDLVAGDVVTAESMRRVDVRLADDTDLYLSAATAPPTGGYLVRDVRAGELVPRSAIGAADQVGLQRVTVRADAVSVQGLVRGSRVDLFVTPKTRLSANESAKTTKVLSAAGVAAIQSSGGGLGSSATTSVSLYVPTESVQAVVEAVDAESKLTLVPVAEGAGVAGGPGVPSSEPAPGSTS